MTKPPTYRIIMSGGGTGGHIFPAIAIANELKRRLPNSEFLFVGAKDKMEMQKVPDAGFNIKGLWISGIQRKLSLKNLSFPFKLISSLLKSKRIIKDFKPHLAVGTGGYASGPLLWAAQKAGIPNAVQEQNAFPGITNKRLAKQADRIFVAYPGMEEYFPKTAIRILGNPVRSEVYTDLPSKEQAVQHFNLLPNKLTILSVGGSLGSSTLNNSWLAGIERVANSDHQLIWQTGSLTYDSVIESVKIVPSNIQITKFITDMKMAYAAADIIVSRAGAIAISELALIGKPVILVPFPFAAEDHQTKNAMALVENNAARIRSDSESVQHLVDDVMDLLSDQEAQSELSEQIKQLAKPTATEDIVDELISLLKSKS